MKTASQLYAALRRFQDAYAAALRPLCERTGMAQGAVDILLFFSIFIPYTSFLHTNVPFTPFRQEITPV